jgi:chromosome partitioning protein
VRTLAIASPKGGVGKTAGAVHLSKIAATLGLRVLLIDCDENRSSWDWVSGGGDAMGDIDVTRATADQIPALRRGSARYDLVVIDLPGAREGAMRAVLDGPVADYLLVPTLAEVMDLRPVVRVVRREIIPLGLPYAVVFCKVPTAQIPVARERQAEVRTGSGVAVATTIVRQYSVVNEAVERSCTVMDIRGRHSAARRVEADYRALAVETFEPLGFDVASLRREAAWLGSA